MSYLYILTNTKNGKKFVGKTGFSQETLKLILYHVLDNEEHYNVLLQKDWHKYPFKLTFEEHDDVIKACDNIINDEELLNPINGYNVYADLKTNRGRHRKDNIFSDDICLLYCWFNNIQYIVRTLNLERNTISNRLANFELFDNHYFYRNIARYEDYYWSSIRMIYIENKCLTAAQIMDKMLNRYEISGMLRITPRKISSFYSINNIYSTKDKSQGCLIFCPKAKEK